MPPRRAGSRSGLLRSPPANAARPLPDHPRAGVDLALGRCADVEPIRFAVGAAPPVQSPGQIGTGGDGLRLQRLHRPRQRHLADAGEVRVEGDLLDEGEAVAMPGEGERSAVGAAVDPELGPGGRHELDPHDVGRLRSDRCRPRQGQRSEKRCDRGEGAWHGMMKHALSLPASRVAASAGQLCRVTPVRCRRPSRRASPRSRRSPGRCDRHW